MEKEPVDTREMVTTRCPACETVNEGWAGSVGRCSECWQALGFMAVRKVKPPKLPKETAGKQKFREEAQMMLASIKEAPHA